MTDLEKVIEGLESLHTRLLDVAMQDSVFMLDVSMVANAIDLLKGQEAISADTKVIGTFNGDVEVYCCRNCRLVLDPTFHYCPNCGRQVKWNA